MFALLAALLCLSKTCLNEQIGMPAPIGWKLGVEYSKSASHVYSKGEMVLLLDSHGRRLAKPIFAMVDSVDEVNGQTEYILSFAGSR